MNSASRYLPLAAAFLLGSGCASKIPEPAPAAPAAPAPGLPPAAEEEARPVPVTVVPAGPAVPEKPQRYGKVTIAAAGDVTLGNHFKAFDPELRKKRGYTEEQVIDYPFLHVRKWFETADIAVVNYEGTFTKAESKTEKNFNFKADPWEAKKLTRAGIDVVSTANNHAYDFGPQGIGDTIRALDEAGLAHFGTGRNLAEARKPARLERNGLGVCFIGYLYLGSHSIEPMILWAKEDKSGIAGVGPVEDNVTKMGAMLAEDLDGLEARGDCDVRVVFFHWGLEGYHDLMPYQPELSQIAADHGADFVIAAHPHVLQANTVLTAKDGGKVPVIYSMGNFVFAGNWNPKKKDSVIVLLTADVTPEGRTRTMELVPVYVDRFPEFPFQPYPQPPDKAQKVLEKMRCWERAKDVQECEEPHP